MIFLKTNNLQIFVVRDCAEFFQLKMEKYVLFVFTPVKKSCTPEMTLAAEENCSCRSERQVRVVSGNRQTA